MDRGTMSQTELDQVFFCAAGGCEDGETRETRIMNGARDTERVLKRSGTDRRGRSFPLRSPAPPTRSLCSSLRRPRSLPLPPDDNFAPTHTCRRRSSSRRFADVCRRRWPTSTRILIAIQGCRLIRKKQDTRRVSDRIRYIALASAFPHETWFRTVHKLRVIYEQYS